MTEIAHGSVGVELQDGVTAGLERIERKFDETMRDISHQEAVAKINADLAPLDDKIAKAKRKVKELEGEKATVRADANTKALDRKIKNAQRQVKRLDGQKATLEIELKGAEKALATERSLQALGEKRHEAELKYERDRSKVVSDADAQNRRSEAERMRLIERNARVSSSLRRQAEREVLSAHSEALAIERQRAQAERDANKSIRDSTIGVAKMKRQYIELGDSLERLELQRRKARGDQKAIMKIDLQQTEVAGEMELLKRELERIGSPIDLDVDLHPGKDAGLAMRNWFAQNQGGLGSLAAAAGLHMGSKMGSAFMGRFNSVRTRGIRQSLKDMSGSALSKTGQMGLQGLSRLGGVLQNLSNMTVRLGPFTATIRQAVVATSLFAPIILDLVGALGSLISVTGSAALGVGALGAALVGGAIPVFAGMGFVIKDVVQEFKSVKKAQKAYDDAVMKGNTTLATTKLKELRATMGNVSKETVRQIGLAQKIGTAWDAATKPAHAAVWTAIGDGLQTVSDYMPMMAKRTNQAMGIAQKATHRWMEALRTPEAKNAINEMMGNFNKSLGPVMDGLGNIVAYLGRVGRVASRSLPGLANSFKAWSKTLLDSSDNAGELATKVENVIQSAKDVGNFFMAAGRLMKAFFGGGVEAGQGFANTMTAAMNRWTASLQTTTGRASLKSFFDEAVHGAQSLYGFLAPIITSFSRWASEIAPFARTFFQFAGYISQFAAELLKVTALRGPLTALAATLGTLWAINKISSATRALSGFTTGLLGLNRAAAATRTANVASTVSALAPAAVAAERQVAGRVAASTASRWSTGATVATSAIATRGMTQTAVAAERSAVAMTRAGRAANIAKAGLAGLGGVALGIPTVAAGAGVAVVGAAGAMYLWANRTQQWEKSTKSAEGYAKQFGMIVNQLGPANDQLAASSLGVAQSNLDVKASQKQVNHEEAALQKLRQTGQKGSKAYIALNQQHKQSILGLRQARLNDITVERMQQDQRKQEIQGIKDTITAARNERTERQNAVDDLGKNNLADYYKTVEANAKAAGKSVHDYLKDKPDQAFPVDRLEKYGAALKLLRESQDKWSSSLDIGHLQMLNLHRAMEGLPSIAQKSAKLFNDLYKMAPDQRLDRKIAVKFQDPGQAVKAARAAGSAIKGGVPAKVVTNAVVNAKNAKQAINDLRALKIPSKVLKIVQQGGPAALRILQDIVGKKLAPKVLHILGSDKDAKSKYNALQKLGLSPKILRMLGDNRDALSKAATANNTVLRTLAQIIQRTIKNPSNLFTTLGSVTQWIIRKVRGAATGSGGGGQEKAATASTAAYQDRAYQKVQDGTIKKVTGAQQQRGGKITQPRAVYGEEPSPEYVISTNPSYKKQNVRYLRQAAQALGVEMAAGGKGGGKFLDPTKKKPKRKWEADNGNEFNPSKTLPRQPKKKRTKKAHKPYTMARGWASYIEGLHTQQDYWEREVSIRDSQVREPEDYVIKLADKEVKDPITGEVTKVEQYGPNTTAIDAYKQQINEVMVAVTQVLQIIQALVQGIPKAQSAVKDEIGFHDHNIKDAKQAIKDENKRWGGLSDSDRKNSAKKQAHDDRITKQKNIVQRNEDANRDLRSDKAQLKDDAVEAGFDWRETVIEYGDYKREHDAATGEGDSQAAAQNDSASGAGGGSGGDSGSTSGIYYANADAANTSAEKMDVIKQFAGNMQVAAASAAQMTQSIGSSATGGGAQINAAAMSPVTAGTVNPGGASSAAFSSGGAARAAMASGSAASGAVAASSPAASAPSAAPATAAPSVTNQTINVTPTFANVPPEPMPFAQGVAFEIAGAL